MPNAVALKWWQRLSLEQRENVKNILEGLPLNAKRHLKTNIEQYCEEYHYPQPGHEDIIDSCFYIFFRPIKKL